MTTETQISLLSSNLEQSPHNEHASCVAMYFNREPTSDELEEFCRDRTNFQGLGLSPDLWVLEDNNFKVRVHPTLVSDQAGLVRVLVAAG